MSKYNNDKMKPSEFNANSSQSDKTGFRFTKKELQSEEPWGYKFEKISDKILLIFGIIFSVGVIAIIITHPPSDAIRNFSNFISLHDGTHSIDRSAQESRYVKEISVADLVLDNKNNDILVLKLDWRNAEHADSTIDAALDIKVIQDGQVCKRISDSPDISLSSEIDFKTAETSIKPTEKQTVYLAYPINKDKRVDVLISAWVNEEIFGNESSAIVACYEFDKDGNLIKSGGNLITRAAYIEATGAQV